MEDKLWHMTPVAHPHHDIGLKPPVIPLLFLTRFEIHWMSVYTETK
jgi:hypothetical protein